MLNASDMQLKYSRYTQYRHTILRPQKRQWRISRTRRDEDSMVSINWPTSSALAPLARHIEAKLQCRVDAILRDARRKLSNIANLTGC